MSLAGLAKLVAVLSWLLSISRSAAGGLLGRLWAVTSQERVFVVMASYYIIYENWDVFRTGEPIPILLEIGKTIFSVDVAIEEHTIAVITGEVAGMSAVLAVVSVVSALATLSMWLRAGAFILMRWNRNYGVVDAWGWPFVVYGFLAFAASAAQGDPRVPFTGLATLLMNFDQVFDPEMLRAAWLENSSVGTVRDVPYVSDGLPDWVTAPATNETVAADALGNESASMRP